MRDSVAVGTRWIVDASNVVGSRPDGWWKDKPAALRRLIDQIARWRVEVGEPVLVVADGHPMPRAPEGTHDGVHLRYAHSSARDAADDEIVRIVAGHAEASSLVVVTSDRGLRGRVSRYGVEIEGAGRFRTRLEHIAPQTAHSDGASRLS